MKKRKLLLTSLLASVLVVGGTLVSCTASRTSSGSSEEDPTTTVENPDGDTTGGDGDTTTVEPDPVEPEEPATLVSIAVTSLPNITEYAVGETFDSTGLVVTAIYDDSTTAVVTGYTLSDVDTSKAGTKEVTVTYTEGDVTVTTQFEISVATYYSLTYQASESDPDNLITAFSYSALGINIRDDDKTVITRAKEGETVYFQFIDGSSFDAVYLNGETELVRLVDDYPLYYIYSFEMPATDVVITVTWDTQYDLSYVTAGVEVGEVTIAFCAGRYNFNTTYTKADAGTTIYVNIGTDLDTETYEIISCSVVDGSDNPLELTDLGGPQNGNRVVRSWYFTMPSSNVIATITFGYASE